MANPHGKERGRSASFLAVVNAFSRTASAARVTIVGRAGGPGERGRPGFRQGLSREAACACRSFDVISDSVGNAAAVDIIADGRGGRFSPRASGFNLPPAVRIK